MNRECPLAIAVRIDEASVFDKGLTRGLGEFGCGAPYSGRCMLADDYHDIPFLHEFE
jgi:hypothetical protein